MAASSGSWLADFDDRVVSQPGLPDAGGIKAISRKVEGAERLIPPEDQIQYCIPERMPATSPPASQLPWNTVPILIGY